MPFTATGTAIHRSFLVTKRGSQNEKRVTAPVRRSPSLAHLSSPASHTVCAASEPTTRTAAVGAETTRRPAATGRIRIQSSGCRDGRRNPRVLHANGSQRAQTIPVSGVEVAWDKACRARAHAARRQRFLPNPSPQLGRGCVACKPHPGHRHVPEIQDRAAAGVTQRSGGSKSGCLQTWRCLRQ